jgi:hypothetical protein
MGWALPSAGRKRIISFFAQCSNAGALWIFYSMPDTVELEAELARLKQEHRDLDAAIDALEGIIAGDQLQVQRLKKRKLSLKDQIIQIEDQLTPDISA